MFKEKDYILFAKVQGSLLQINLCKDDFENSVRVRSSLPKYDYNYTVSLNDGTNNEVSFKKSVGEFFDVNGVLHLEKYHNELGGLLSKLQQKKKN